MVAMTKLRPGQKRRFNPHLPRVQREREMQRKELENQYGPMLSEQKNTRDELKALSDKHKQHAEAKADVEKHKRALRQEVELWMRKPEYRLPQGDPEGERVRSYVSKLYQEIEGDEVPQDRNLNPSSGFALHARGGAADE